MSKKMRNAMLRNEGSARIKIALVLNALNARKAAAQFDAVQAQIKKMNKTMKDVQEQFRSALTSLDKDKS
jgi:hypothetical protein